MFARPRREHTALPRRCKGGNGCDHVCADEGRSLVKKAWHDRKLQSRPPVGMGRVRQVAPWDSWSGAGGRELLQTRFTGGEQKARTSGAEPPLATITSPFQGRG